MFEVGIKVKGCSENSVDFCQNSRPVIPKDSILLDHRPDNLNCHLLFIEVKIF